MPFIIDENSGRISVYLDEDFELDYDSNNKQYSFTVVAKDNPGQKQTNSGNYWLYIIYYEMTKIQTGPYF